MANFHGKISYMITDKSIEPVPTISAHQVYFMTSKERREARYQRRKQKRLDKIHEDNVMFCNTNIVFSSKAISEGYRKCRKVSKWKESTQRYGARLFLRAPKDSKKLKNEMWKPQGFQEFDIIERGKLRHIKSVCIAEKCVQSALSNESLVPVIRKHLIYDNGASLKGKGTSFTEERFKEHLKSHLRKYGLVGGIFFFDFKGYFDHIEHKRLKEDTGRILYDNIVRRTYFKMIDAMRTEIGLGLGSQVYQISAIFYPNKLDHFMKDNLRIKRYAHFMDDGYIIEPNLDVLNALKDLFISKCKENGIIPNKKKCRIIKITKPFIFLKKRYFITNSHKIVIRNRKDTCVKERVRLKKFKELLDESLETFSRINLNFHSWLCTHIRKTSFHIFENMIRYFNNLFINYGTYQIPNGNGRKKHRKLYRALKIASKGGRNVRNYTYA